MNLNEAKQYLLKKRNILCATAGLMASTILTGCGSKSKDFLLQGTMLEDCVVIELNNEKMIVKLDVREGHLHYQEIGGGVEYTDFEFCSHSLPRISTPNFENVISYLTKEEIEKAMNGTLTENDVVNIIARINEMSVEEDKEDLSR